jgi:hypothetical protein
MAALNDETVMVGIGDACPGYAAAEGTQGNSTAMVCTATLTAGSPME